MRTFCTLMLLVLAAAWAAGLMPGCATTGGGAKSVTPRGDVHAFYYTWYGNPETDGAYAHWNHFVMLRDGQGPDFTPPEEIGANYYPKAPLYSSNDPVAVGEHMAQMKAAGIGVVVATWWGIDDFTGRALQVVFDQAAAHGLAVCFHIEPFPGRNAATTREALVHLLETFGDHPALYRDPARGNRPWVYLYDSYLTPAEEWATLLRPEGAQTIRGTEYDAVVIGLWVKKQDGPFMTTGGFDGFYTYFATDGFTYGSTPANWPALAAFARGHGLLFVPSVGPGYCDTRIRPWNEVNTRGRENGAYYDRMWQAAIDEAPAAISITSYNEWHEGTQIEQAIPKRTETFTYLDYEDRAPEYYLERTAWWVSRWKRAVSGPREIYRPWREGGSSLHVSRPRPPRPAPPAPSPRGPR
jgi:glycoprotein endo-alpha-1,2-mannosidase